MSQLLEVQILRQRGSATMYEYDTQLAWLLTTNDNAGKGLRVRDDLGNLNRYHATGGNFQAIKSNRESL